MFPAPSRNETVLPSGNIPFVAGQWQSVEIIRKGNRLSVLCNGKNAGEIGFNIGKFQNLTLSATSADCEIRGILLNRLP